MKRRLLLVSYLLTGCTSFPYGGVIKESERFVREVHPEAFKSFTTKLPNEGEELHYVSLGNAHGPIVILIHGSPGSWGSYASYFKNTQLTSQFQVVSFDRWGYGQHGRGEPKTSLNDQASLVLEIIKEVNPSGQRPVIVVGHSYGGPVAAYLAAYHSNAVDGLVLLAASVDPELEKTKWYQYVAELRGFRWLIPSDLDVCNREILGLRPELEKMKSKLVDIKQPTYVLQGEIDILVPKGNLEYLRSQLKTSRVQYELIPRARHFLPWSFPSEVIKAIQWANGEIENTKEKI